MRLSPLFAAAAWIAAGCAPASDLDGLTPSEDYAAHRSAIVGGTVDNGDPAVVAIAVGTSEFCTGALIGPKTVLTAAHCIYAYGQGQTYYVLFGTDVSTPTSYVQVAAQFKHPNYTGSNPGYDVGVLKLATAVLGVTPIEPNPVALTSSDVGKPIRHVGFGTTSGTGSGGGTKREVTYNLRQVTPLEIESGASGRQTCGGDSGGPALMVTAGSAAERVVGTVSYGDPDCVQYGMDSRVDVVLPWVKQTYAPWEAPTCAEDGKCLPGCTPVDQDCACVADGVCNPDCKNLLRDPDCPKDCVQNSVCSLQPCPVPDPDCVGLGETCAADAYCKTRACVADPQHAGKYCSKPCAGASDCPAGMECAASQLCLFVQKPVAKLGEVCSPDVWCESNFVCSGPVNAPLRCARPCGSAGDCPATDSCEGGVNGVRYCRSPESPSQPRAKQVTLTGAPSQLGPGVAGCAAAGGSSLGTLTLLSSLGLALVRRRGGR